MNAIEKIGIGCNMTHFVLPVRSALAYALFSASFDTAGFNEPEHRFTKPV
jgi:hypothetical protein